MRDGFPMWGGGVRGAGTGPRLKVGGRGLRRESSTGGIAQVKEGRNRDDTAPPPRPHYHHTVDDPLELGAYLCEKVSEGKVEGGLEAV